jgi:hypothetical protein
MAKTKQNIEVQQDRQILDVLSRMEALGNFFMKEVRDLKVEFLTLKPGTKASRRKHTQILEMQDTILNRKPKTPSK